MKKKIVKYHDAKRYIMDKFHTLLKDFPSKKTPYSNIK